MIYGNINNEFFEQQAAVLPKPLKEALHCLKGMDLAGHETGAFPTEIGGVPMTVLKVPAFREKLPAPDGPLYYPWHEPDEEEKMLTLIPYFAWDNRGENEMCVWFRV